MTYKLGDRAKESVSSSGVGAFALTGPDANFQRFQDYMAVGDTTGYSAVNGSTEWETGIGTLTSANVLARTIVFDSSAGKGVKVNFTAPPVVFCCVPAEQMLTTASTDTTATLKDFSMTPKPMAKIGTPSLSVDHPLYGGASLFTSPGNLINTPDHPDFSFAAGVPWTVEAIVYRAVDGQVQSVVSKRTGDSGWTLAVLNDNTIFGYREGYGNIVTATQVPKDTWSHIVMCYDGAKLYMFVNGVGALGAGGAGTVMPWADNAYPMNIGASNQAGSDSFRGYIGAVRITKNVCRYTVPFSAPTGPFPLDSEGDPDYANVSLLLPFNFTRANRATLGAFPMRVDVPPANPHRMNDEFEGDALLPAWSLQVNAYAPAPKLNDGVLRFPMVTQVAGNANRVAAAYRPIDWSDESVAYYFALTRSTFFSNYHGPCAGFHVASTNEQAVLSWLGHSAYGNGSHLLMRFNGWSSSGSEVNYGANWTGATRTYLRFQKVPGQNAFYIAFSTDGGYYWRHNTPYDMSVHGGVPTHIFAGSHLYTDDGSLKHAHGVDWFRVGAASYLHGEDIHS